ncbi:hypothetical protein LSAT2_030702, partial [Lamellibrachia satsuma]
MVSILKHELSPIHLYLAKHEDEVNSTPKAELNSFLVVVLHTRWEVPEANMKICVLIDGQRLINALGKPHGCQTFGDCFDVFLLNLQLDK